MYLAIDNVRLALEPHTIEYQPYDHTTGMMADQRPTVHPGSDYIILNCTWGSDFSVEDVLAELNVARGNRGVHSVTFEPTRGGELMTINAFMGKPRYTAIGYAVSGCLSTNSFSIPFVQVDMPTFLYPLRSSLWQVVSVMSPFAFITAPAAGRIIAVDGHITDLGSGAGQTRIQISNGATNYLSTPGDFIVAGGNHRLQNAVLAAVLDFAQGDRIDVDITTIPAGADSGNALITVWAWIYRP